MYDMYLAEAEINNNYAIFGNNDEKKQELLNVILKKHKISQQDLDTSLVWYNAHLEIYTKMNDRVSKRYDTHIAQLQKEIDVENALIAERNRVNLLEDKRGFFLQTASLLQNTISFKVDSIEWNTGDNLEVSFDILGVNNNKNPELLCYIHCEDTIIKIQEKISVNGSFSKMMPHRMNNVKSFSASIHLSDSISKANILIHKFGIFHRKNEGNKLLLDTPQLIEEEAIRL